MSFPDKLEIFPFAIIVLIIFISSIYASTSCLIFRLLNILSIYTVIFDKEHETLLLANYLKI